MTTASDGLVRARRSRLMCPGDRPRMMEKVAGSDADVALFDLEDAVIASRKHEARALVREALESLDFGDKEIAVRINGLHSGLLVGDLLEVVSPKLMAVHVPKVEHPRAIWVVEALLDHLEREREVARRIAIVPTLETVAGIRNALDVARASPRVAALQFGIADFVASTGIEPSASRLALARGSIVFAAAEAGVQALDTGYLAVRDLAGFEAEAREARACGFVGKTCLHPDQVPIANAVFSPSAEQVERARAVLAAFERASARGEGTLELEGELVDEPIARRAAAILATARRLGFERHAPGRAHGGDADGG